jgi:MFS family permease
MGFLYVTATAALPAWFSSRRSLALGIASSGAGLGGLVYSLAAGAAIESLGPAKTYRLLALCAIICNLPCSFILRARDTSARSRIRVFDFRAYARIEVLLIVFWGTVTELGYIALLYSLPAYASSVVGLSSRQGSIVGACLNLGLGIGRPIVGYYSDAFGRINIAASMTALCGVLCLTLWVPAKSYSVLIAFALAGGTVCGTFWGTVIPVTAEIVGLHKVQSTFGMICFSLVLTTTFGEPVALQIVASKGYLSAQIFIGCMFLAGALSLWILRSWKICELERKALIERSGNLGGVGTFDIWFMPRRLFTRRKV